MAFFSSLGKFLKRPEEDYGLYDPLEQSKSGGVGPSPLAQDLMTRPLPIQPVPSHRPADESRKVHTEYHPAGIPESLTEKMMKKAARDYGTYVDEDAPYLEQYLHPNYDVLPKQSLRPTIGTPRDIEHRKMARITELEPRREDLSQLYKDASAGKTNISLGSYRALPQYRVDRPNSEGLGEYKYDTSHPDYNSVYDVWDFDTKAPLSNMPHGNILGSIEDWVAKQFMQRMGRPYAVYERFPKSK